MRASIRDIIKAVGCDEATAKKVEQKINEMDLVDWSEDSMSKIHKAAKIAFAELKNRGELSA
jgi:sulfate adenylyltransferase subunit 1 (EFTu-like GTPase family)